MSSPVERAQLVAMIRATPWAWSLGVLGIVIICCEYSRSDQESVVALWTGIVGLVVLSRLLAWAAWRWLGHDAPLGASWALVILGTNLLFAGCWGLLSMLLWAAGPMSSEGLLHVTLAAIAMGGTSRLAGFERAMVTYVVLVLAPLVARDVWLGSSFHTLMVVLMPMIGMYALFSGLSTSRALRELERQRGRKAEIATQLRDEVERGELARAQLEEAGQARTHIFVAANHDLRQPLHAMGLLVQALLSLPASDEVRLLAERLQDCTEGMTDAVDELIELARAYAQPREPRLAPLALQPLVEECCRPYAALAVAKGLQLEADVSNLGVVSDGGMLARIIANLVSNAVRYTHKGRVLVVAEAVPSGAINLHIRDTGIGMAAAHLPRIFEPFYQVGNPGRDRSNGLGLGLATVRRFASQLGIEIDVSSVPDVGTRFTLRLTRCEPPARDTPAAAEADAAPFAGRRVMAVEDDAAITDALQRLLQAWGCEVVVAVDGDQAMRLARAGRAPDVVIADLCLPGSLSGVDAVQRLRQIWSVPVPALLISGTTDGPGVEAARAAGLPLLIKPVAPARLRAFLAQAFSSMPRP
ncbi:hybrid sensor histidine kinase/response regulator [Roseateles sp.]|uniref:ATP-binding response regulator n=1 Tax=Roseateles sp. TaxID=1971397 RepID=UPI0039EA1576